MTSRCSGKLICNLHFLRFFDNFVHKIEKMNDSVNLF